MNPKANRFKLLILVEQQTFTGIILKNVKSREFQAGQIAVAANFTKQHLEHYERNLRQTEVEPDERVVTPCHQIHGKKWRKIRVYAKDIVFNLDIVYRQKKCKDDNAPSAVEMESAAAAAAASAALL